MNRSDSVHWEAGIGKGVDNKRGEMGGDEGHRRKRWVGRAGERLGQSVSHRFPLLG